MESDLKIECYVKIGYQNSAIQTKYDTAWWRLLSEEDLNNIENANEGDDDVDESSSDIEEMKKILKTGKKRGRRAQSKYQHVNDLVETICENEYFRRKLIFTNNKPQKNKEVYDKVIKELNEKCESNFCLTGLDQIEKLCIAMCTEKLFT